jgi:hypothetical protein
MSTTEFSKLIKLAEMRRHQYLLTKLQQEGQSLTRSEIKELEILEAGPRASCLLSTIAQVAEYFGVSTRAVDKWIVEGCPKTPMGNFDILEICKWRSDRARRSGRNFKY